MEFNTVCHCMHAIPEDMQQPLPTPLPCSCKTQLVGFEKTLFYTQAQDGKCKYLLAGPLQLSLKERECGKSAVIGKDGKLLHACAEHEEEYEKGYEALGKPKQVPMLRMFGVDLGKDIPTFPLVRMNAVSSFPHDAWKSF